MFESLIYFFSDTNPESDSQNLKPDHGGSSQSATRTKSDLEKHRIPKILVLEFINQLLESNNQKRINHLTDFQKIRWSSLKDCQWDKVTCRNLELLTFYLGHDIMKDCLVDKKMNYLTLLQNLVAKTGHRLIHNKGYRHQRRAVWGYDHLTIK